MGAGRLDHVLALQDVQGDRHAGPPDPQHQRQKLMRERNIVSVQTVVAHEDPAGEALIDGEAAVGQSRVGHLDGDRVDIAQEKLAQGGAGIHRGPEVLGPHPQGCSGHLDEGQVGRAVHGEDDRHSHHALPADDGNLDLLHIVLADRHHGDDALLHEIDMLDGLSGARQNGLEIESDGFQERLKQAQIVG